ncbi:MAG TPA: hypothetical protein VGN00_05945 [Puia sp.]|jgi:hypothetical protein
MVKALFFVILLFGVRVCAFAQPGGGCFAEVVLDRHAVFVQQPMKVTITVLTSTWYTAPLDFSNIRIPDAFILKFDRTTPGVFQRGGKQYAGLQFYFIVFPYKEGDFIIPPIEIVARTPPPEGSVSRKIVVRTPSRGYVVKPVPAGSWFVAKDVSIGESWNRSLKDLKVGDVVERTVTIYAHGTLPQFIPPLPKLELGFAATYWSEAQLKDERNEEDANGRMTQRVVYLLEKEGDFALPDVKMSWWNPNSCKLFARTAAGAEIHVKANASLGMLATLKDSLDAGANIKPAKVHKQTWTIGGVAWYWAVTILAAMIWLSYYIVRMLLKIPDFYKKRHAVYLGSEKFAFRRFMKAPPFLPDLFSAMYTWWDRFARPKGAFSVHSQLQDAKFMHIREGLCDDMRRRFRDNAKYIKSSCIIKKEWKAYRRKMIKDPSVTKDYRISIYQQTRGYMGNPIR